MRLVLYVVFAGIVAVANGPARAGRVDGLYRASVPVAGQDADERGKAITTAFTQVLIKVTGEARIEERPEARDLLHDASRYVQQYRYEKTAQPAPVPDQPSTEAIVLQVQFDTAAVNEALRKRGLPVWGDLRPSTLIWLAVERGAQRNLIGADSDPAIVSVLRDAAGRRGVPILLPLLDLEDQAALPVADVWGNFRATVLKASQRYRPDAVLVGRVYRQGNGMWEAAWSFYHGDNSSNWIASGAFSSQVLFQGLDGAADLLAARFAPIGLGLSGGKFLLRVEAVNSLHDYVRLQRYLKELQPIQAVETDKIGPGEAQFRVTLEGDYRLLQQVIGLSNQLQPVATEAGTDSGEQPALPILHYRLVP